MSFTGLKNISYIKFKIPSVQECQPLQRLLNVELNSSDMMDFSDALKKSGLESQAMNKLNKNFVHIHHVYYPYDKSTQLVLNDKLLVVKEKNLPILIFLEKITSNILKKGDLKISPSSSHNYDDIWEEALASCPISNVLGKDKKECYEEVHNLEKIKQGAKEINKRLQNILINLINMP